MFISSVDEDDVEAQPDVSLFLAVAEWTEMGQPDTVTVTIDLGDALNE